MKWPMSGEGRLLAEVKGKVGGAKMRRSNRTSFAAMRRGAMRNKPEWVVPLAPGDYGGGGGGILDRQPHWMFYRTGSFASGGVSGQTQGWLFALTPELFPRDGNDTMAGFVNYSEGANARYRVAGFQGKLHWTPLYPSYAITTFSSENLSGTFWYGWFKVDANAPPLSTDTIEESYPWGTFGTLAGGANGEAATRTFTPIAQAGNATGLFNRDARFRAKLMHSNSFTWTMKAIGQSEDSAGTGFQQSFIPTGYEIPLPRKLVCNVGRGEALALAYWYRDNSFVGGGVGGSPNSIFTFPSLRVKVYELD